MKIGLKYQRVLFVVVCTLMLFSLMVDMQALSTVRNIPEGLPGFVYLLSSQLKPVSIELMLATAMLFYCAYIAFFKKQIKASFGNVVLSVLFSSFLVIGESFRYYGNLDFILESKQQTIIAVLVLFGLGFMVYIGIGIVEKEIKQKILLKEIDETERNEKHFFRKAFTVIILCWIVFSLPYYPGSVPHDGRRQLIMFDGYAIMTNHHPYIATMILGSLASLGRVVFGNNHGIILIIVLQMVFGGYVFSSICNSIWICFSKRVAKATVLFYALCPLWWTYMQAVIKDTVFFIAVSWLTLLCFEVCWNIHRKYIFGQALAAVFLICAFRNEGALYAILILGLTILLTSINRKKMLSVLCLTVVIVIVTEIVTVFGIKVQQRNPFESKSIIAQQIARVIKQKEDVLEEADLEIIDKVLEVKDIQKRYNPELSDPVKNRYRSDATEEEWKAFWKLWLEWAVEYPDIYLEAIVGKCFGYFDPLYFYKGSMKYLLYNKDYLQMEDKNVVYSQYATRTETRDMIYDLTCAQDNIPFIALLVNPATYVWMFIIMLIKGPNKYRKPFLLVPLMNLMICIVSPVNGYIRYMLPMVASMPLYVALMFDMNVPNKDTQGE